MQQQRTKSSRQKLPRWQGWLPLALLPVAAGLIAASWPRWALMWSLAVAIYCRLQVAHLATHARAGSAVVEARRLSDRLAGLGCPGVPPRRCSRAPRQRGEWLFAALKLTLGVVLLAAIRSLPSGHAYLAGWVGMVGIVFVLHFGLFHLLSCFWRSVGRGRPAADGLAACRDERQRVLGPPLEHGLPRSDAPVPLPPADGAARSAAGHRRRVRCSAAWSTTW